MPLMTMTPKAMQRKPSIRGRAWRLLRLAVLWARTGSAVQSLRLLKTLRRTAASASASAAAGGTDRLRYGEREFSIDETPAFRFRTPSARVLRFIPCIAPAVPDTPAGGFYGDDDRYFFRGREDCCYDDGEPSECGGGGVESLDDDGADDDEQLLERALMEASSCSSFGAAEGGGDAGVDVKADEFIARFYAQMKLQRQISCCSTPR